MESMIQDLGLDGLTDDQRVTLAVQLWDSVADRPGTAPLTEAQRAELQRRLADSIARPGAVTPWEEVDARVLAKGRK